MDSYSINNGLQIFKFSTNTNDMYAMKLYLFCFSFLCLSFYFIRNKIYATSWHACRLCLLKIGKWSDHY